MAKHSEYFYDADFDVSPTYDESNKAKKHGKQKHSYADPGKSSWWWSSYDYDHSTYTYSAEYGSRAWRSKVGDSYQNYYDHENKQQIYLNLLNQLQTSANVLSNSSRGRIVLRWSGGKDVNTVLPDEYSRQFIYLSPDNLLTINASGDKVVEEKTIDALTGTVYLAATLQASVNTEAYEQAKSARNSIKSSRIGTKRLLILTDAIRLWEAMETAVARKQLMKDWVGFTPYIASAIERSAATKEDVQSKIEENADKPSASICMLGLAWNLAHSSKLVSLPSVYDECLELASKAMAKPITPEKRFKVCHSLSRKIHKKLATIADAEPTKMPVVVDGALLGAHVHNDVDKELKHLGAADSASEANTDDKFNSIHAPPNCNCTRGRQYVIKPVTVLPGAKERYDFIVKDNLEKIRAIRDSLLFRNNISDLTSYGHSRGEIDDNSLFKLWLDDTNIMTNKDIINRKKIAIALLVDQSGSMADCSSGRIRITEARDVAILMIEGLKNNNDIELCVYGHTAEERDWEGVVLREFYSRKDPDSSKCMSLSARQQNHDSYAILHTANLLVNNYEDCARKIIFSISDGQPAGSVYGGRSAIQHMQAVNNACAAGGVEVYGIGVCGAFSQEQGANMYGENRFIVLKDVSSALHVMTRFLRQIAAK